MLPSAAIVETLERYHRMEYPEDFPWDSWKVEHVFVINRDEEVVTLKYRNPRGTQGTHSGVYAKFVMSGIDRFYYLRDTPDALIQRLMDEYDRMRMEIIETLDGLQQTKLQPKLRLVKGIE